MAQRHGNPKTRGRNGFEMMFLHNCPPLHESLSSFHSDGKLDKISVAQLVDAYAASLSHALQELDSRTLPMAPSLRPSWVRGELSKSTKRLAEAGTSSSASACIVKLLEMMEPGKEESHLKDMLRTASHRCSETRINQMVGEEGNLHFPYPAFAWNRQSVQSYEWRHAQHINVLEFVSMFNYLRSISGKLHLQHLRLFHVLDSQVCCGVLAKGRSSSRRLNRCCRRLLPLLLGMDWYLFSLWTISDWQYSDAASRLYPPCRE
jgi:hypothetical protein